jgi:hypothetical protein
MPDFDSKEDPLRLNGDGQDDSLDLPELRPRFSPRARALASRDCRARASRAPERISARLASPVRQVTRHACPRDERLMLLTSPRRRRRRLWTKCHAYPSGSPS